MHGLARVVGRGLRRPAAAPPRSFCTDADFQTFDRRWPRFTDSTFLADHSTAQVQKKRKIKQTTGLVGLQVQPRWRQILIHTYRKTLRVVEQMPADYFYRQATQGFTLKFLTEVLNTHDFEVAERAIGLGQVEELIVIASNELELAEHLLDAQYWEEDPEALDRDEMEHLEAKGGRLRFPFAKRSLREQLFVHKMKQAVDRGDVPWCVGPWNCAKPEKSEVY